MSEAMWIGLSSRERMILLHALASMRASEDAPLADIDALTLKLVHSEPHPKITIGVDRGLVQWTLGNPFPIRICDYDASDEELPDVDERGQRCTIWWEPATTATP
jgi:hypothetical protein